MHTAYGFSRSAGAAVSLARARAANIGGAHHIFSLGGVHKVGDEMYEAFCLVCDDLEQDGGNNRGSGLPQDDLLKVISLHPEMFDRYPQLQFQYPELFRQTHPNNGREYTLH